MEPKRDQTVPDPLTATPAPAPKAEPKQEGSIPAPVPVVPAGPGAGGAAPPKENWVRPPAPTPEAPPRPEPVACPWTFDLAILDGKTVLTAKAGDAVQFKITCERLELQAPRGNIQAIGDIVLSSSGLKGTSQRLTISLQEDRVYLDGQARVVCEREGQELDVQGERLSLRLRAGGSAERQARHEHMKE
jgi:hypothetical protein